MANLMRKMWTKHQVKQIVNDGIKNGEILNFNEFQDEIEIEEEGEALRPNNFNEIKKHKILHCCILDPYENGVFDGLISYSSNETGFVGVGYDNVGSTIRSVIIYENEYMINQSDGNGYTTVVGNYIILFNPII